MNKIMLYLKQTLVKKKYEEEMDGYMDDTWMIHGCRREERDFDEYI